MKFGLGLGLLLTAVSIVGNLLLAYLTVFLFRTPLQQFVERRNKKIPSIPEAEEKSACALVALVPGPSYALKNYLLPLAGVRFRNYFWICLPIHILHAVTGIFLGETLGRTHPLKIAVLILYAIVLALVCRKMVKKLKQQFGGKLPIG
jgi:uncharacterized membrane protein YdjX (TVP38/TMEM64 family)